MRDVEAARELDQDLNPEQEREQEFDRDLHERHRVTSPGLARERDAQEADETATWALDGTRSGPTRRVTAAEVRRIARSELEAELARQLVDCRGNLAEVARRMGKDRSTIRYHLRRFGMLIEERPGPPDSRAPGSGAGSGAGLELDSGSVGAASEPD